MNHSTFEKVMAWGSMLTLIGATIAVFWIAVSAVNTIRTIRPASQPCSP